MLQPERLHVPTDCVMYVLRSPCGSEDGGALGAEMRLHLLMGPRDCRSSMYCIVDRLIVRQEVR